MRILFITNQMPPLVDGVGDYTCNLAREFARHGHEAAVVCREDARIRTDYGDIKVFPVVRRWDSGAARPIVRLVRELGTEVVSLQYVPHGFHPKGLPFPLVRVMREVKKTGVRVQVFCHEVCVFPYGGLKRRVLSLMTKKILRGLLKSCDSVATSIDYYGWVIRDLCPRSGNVAVIPIASNVPESVLDAHERAELRERVAADKEVVVAFFGNRNVDTSMQALHHLVQRGCSVKVLFIGRTGSQSGSHAVPDYKTGVLDLKEISPYFQVADILILPETGRYGCSFKSGSLIVGMRYGLPVVSACGILTSPALKHGENIVFADFGDVPKLERVLESLVGRPDMRRRIGENARILTRDVTWGNTYVQYMHNIDR